MKIRTKLAVAFLTVILGPLVLCVITATLLSSYQLKLIKEYYGIEPSYDTLSDSTLFLSRVTQKMYGKIEQDAVESPEVFQDLAYVENLNSQLRNKYSFLIVREGNTIIYNGAKEAIHIEKLMLPDYSSEETVGDRIVVDGESRYILKQVHYLTRNGEEGSVFIVTLLGELLPELRFLLRDIILAMVLILGCTASLLIAWLYQSMVKPLKQLQEAIHKIKEGNLDFTVEVKNKDEIGELCGDFEEMRRRLKDTMEEKVQYDKESKELISNISHDLKTPITAIKGYAEGILDGVAGTPERQDKYVRTIYNKANDMSRLIDELTFYSKMDTNRIPYTFNKIHVDQYFKDCAEELSLDLEEKNIELTYFNYLEEDVVIIADVEQLKRVVNNIVTNSVKYMDKRRGVINIRIKDAGDFVEVDIEDNGKGISVKDLPYIFDRFYRTDASRNSSQGGSGIGLSIVKKIVEDHGGRIWATSRESTGTVMCMVFRKYQEEYRYE